jgi:uncharacterized protein YeaO (DUF488 family)
LAISIVRLGQPRKEKEGLRLGTVRRPPRGVKKEDFARRDFYDVWLPQLAPSTETVSLALSEPWTDARWKKFEKSYRREMSETGPRQLIELLAKMSQSSDFAVGCYCENEARCHRSILRELLKERGAKLSQP